jgi:hypothetical protein
VLLRSRPQAFAPVALWPLAPRDMSHLGAAEIALKENRGVVSVRAANCPRRNA